MRKKIIRIKKIERIIYANGSTNLVLINFNTNTTTFPIAIESYEDKMVVAFTGYDNHARSLRTNSNIVAEDKKSIIAILSKEKNADQYSNLVYLRSHLELTKYLKMSNVIFSNKLLEKIIEQVERVR